LRLLESIVSGVTLPTAGVDAVRGGVRPVPVLGVVVRFLPLWLAWLLIVVLGRVVCRVAQRIPPVVRLVRRLRAGDVPCGVALRRVLGGEAVVSGARPSGADSTAARRVHVCSPRGRACDRPESGSGTNGS
jgi:hypothetical protein